MEQLIARDRIGLAAAVGCGVALGVSGIYTYWRASRQIRTLNENIKDLKREVDEIRAMSQANSRMGSTGLRSPLALDGPFHSSARFFPVESSIQDTNDETEEFYDFSEYGDQDSITEQVPITQSSTGTMLSARSHTPSNHRPNNLSSRAGSNSVASSRAGLGLSTDHQLTTPLSADPELDEIDCLLDDLRTDKQVIYRKCKALNDRRPSDAAVLWRLSKATHLCGIAVQKVGATGGSVKDKKKELTIESLDYAKRAVDLDPANPECHKWYAVAVGSMADFVPTKEKVHNGHTFRLHVDRALALKPNDPTLHHMLGRWGIEVASLSWVERKVATALFGKIPESSYQEVYKSLIRAYDLRPDWKENLLYLAKTTLALGRKQEATEWMERGLRLEIKGEDDQLAHDDLVALFTKHSKHKHH